MAVQFTIDRDTVLLFTRYGMGQAPEGLQATLVAKYLSVTLESGILPAKVLFYTEGVKLACEGSPVLEQLKSLESQGVELILCKTCLDYFNLTSKVKVGIVGGMGDIVECLQKTAKIISL